MSKINTSTIMNITNNLRNVYQPDQYKNIILPLVILKRFDCVLENDKEEILNEYEFSKTMPNVKDDICKIFNTKFINVSKYDFKKLEEEPDNIKDNFLDYINGYSDNVKEIIRCFGLMKEIDKLDKNNILYSAIKEFNKIDLHPDVVSNRDMGYLFEELIRLFSENALAGDHFTPREVIKLMTEIVLLDKDKMDKITTPGAIMSVYDPTCGSNGITSIVEERIHKISPDTKVIPYGQEINEQSYAIGKADLLIKGGEDGNIRLGNTLTEDKFTEDKFDLIMANPPYGVTWKREQSFVEDEHKTLGFNGRFGAGTPRVNDGSLLFVQHMISKMKPDGSKIAVVLNGSPLFTGDAGSGESNIRKYIIENDLLETIVALPTDLFYNTGISTYIWILNNKKDKERQGKIQLINAIDLYEKMSKALGSKRSYISDAHIKQITDICKEFKESDICKIYDNEYLLYKKVEVRKKSDKKWKDTEQIPYKEDVQAYMEREVLPHIEDAYVIEEKTVVGCEINFTRYFYKYTPLKPSNEIANKILGIEEEIQNMMKELF